MIDKKPLLINLLGGPGCGKSTTAAGVFCLLKLHGIDCELITEFAKDLVWEERQKTFKNQQYIFAKQHHRIWRVIDSVDVVITDSPLILSLVYGQKYNTIDEPFYNNVISLINKYNNLNIILKRNKKYNANGRNQTKEEAEEIDNDIKNTLLKYNISWIEAPGNLDGINKITELTLKEELKFKITK